MHPSAHGRCVAPVRIGRWSLVAAGAVVIADVLDFELVAGNPARHIGWVGKQGKPLTRHDGNWQCPNTGAVYEESARGLVEITDEVPSMPRPSEIPAAAPLIGDEERAAVDRVMRSGMIAGGPEVGAFETEFSRHVDGYECVAVNSGTSALHLGLLAAGDSTRR